MPVCPAAEIVIRKNAESRRELYGAADDPVSSVARAVADAGPATGKLWPGIRRSALRGARKAGCLASPEPLGLTASQGSAPAAARSIGSSWLLKKRKGTFLTRGREGHFKRG
jgi:hypothetical protein